MKKYFGSIKKSIDRGMITVGVKSANMLEINKIKGYITTLSDQKEQMIMEMGKKVYEMYIHEELDLEEIKLACSGIMSIDKKIEEKMDEMKAIEVEEEEILQGMKNEGSIVCTCGQVVPKDAKFCTACGKQLKEEKSNVCQCGNSLPKGAKFCTKCGKKVLE